MQTVSQYTFFLVHRCSVADCALDTLACLLCCLLCVRVCVRLGKSMHLASLAWYSLPVALFCGRIVAAIFQRDDFENKKKHMLQSRTYAYCKNSGEESSPGQVLLPHLSCYQMLMPLSFIF